jgi:hypothetical protein
VIGTAVLVARVCASEETDCVCDQRQCCSWRLRRARAGAKPMRALAAVTSLRTRPMPFGATAGARQQAGAQKLSLSSLLGEPGMAQKVADIEDASGPAGLVRLLHTTAVQRGLHSYVDPATG